MLCSRNLELACCLTLFKLGAPLLSLSSITPTSIPEYELLVTTSARTPNNTAACGGIRVPMKGAVLHRVIVAVHMSEGRAARMPDQQAYCAHRGQARPELLHVVVHYMVKSQKIEFKLNWQTAI